MRFDHAKQILIRLISDSVVLWTFLGLSTANHSLAALLPVHGFTRVMLHATVIFCDLTAAVRVGRLHARELTDAPEMLGREKGPEVK